MHLLLDPARRPVIGHRGDRAHAPENTLESLRQAVELGVDGVEFDLHLSADGVPVLMHDPTLDRTTDGSGLVRTRTVAQLKELDAGARFTADGGRSHPWANRGVRIPTLAEALEALPREMPMIVELKTAEVARPALEILRQAAVLDRVLIGSFVDTALVPFMQARVPVSPGSNTLTRLYPSALLRRRVSAPGFQALCIPRFHKWIPLPVQGFAAMMRAAGGPTHIWTVNDPRQARALWDSGINGIISDDPRVMLRERGAAA